MQTSVMLTDIYITNTRTSVNIDHTKKTFADCLNYSRSTYKYHLFFQDFDESARDIFNKSFDIYIQ